MHSVHMEHPPSMENVQVSMCKLGLISTGMANFKLLSFGSLVSTVVLPLLGMGLGKVTVGFSPSMEG